MGSHERGNFQSADTTNPVATSASAPPSSAQKTRSASEIIRATQQFAQEHELKSAALLASTLAIAAALAVAICLAEPWPAKIPPAVVLGLIQIRQFIFVHDFHHGAIFRRSVVGSFVMRLVGMHLLTPHSVWRETHNHHHQHIGKLPASWGYSPMLTVGEWSRLSKAERRTYELNHNPWMILVSFLVTFGFYFCIGYASTNWRRHWEGPASLVLKAVQVAVAVHFFGWLTAMFLLLVPGMVGAAIGIYAIRAQHHGEDVKWTPEPEWTYFEGATRGSTMFLQSKVMHWFTGNIGYHHVHHLNHNIPFYRLPEAMAATPELHNPVTTSWSLRDVRAALTKSLWDDRNHRMVDWNEAKSLVESGQIS